MDKSMVYVHSIYIPSVVHLLLGFFSEHLPFSVAIMYQLHIIMYRVG